MLLFPSLTAERSNSGSAGGTWDGLGLNGKPSMRCSTLLGILTGVLLYLVMGAVVFNMLETPHEEGQHIRLQDTRRDFLFNYTCVSPEILQELIEVREVEEVREDF